MRALPLLLLLLAAALCCSSPTAAQAKIEPWIGFHGSWATYAMNDVNRGIGAINREFAAQGLHWDEIKNGFGFGAAAGVDLPVGATVGVGYDRLMGSSDASVGGEGRKYDQPANTFRGFVEYKLPVPGPVGLHMGVAGGVVAEAGTIEIETVAVSTTTWKLSGTSPLFEGYFGSTFWATPQIGIAGAAGYRYAKIGKIKSKGTEEGQSTVVTNADGSNMAIDYSGVFVRLGLKLAFTKK